MSKINLKKNDKNRLTKNNDPNYVPYECIETVQKLTIAQVRNQSSFSNISDEEAIEIIESLFKLSIVTYKIFKDEEFRNVSSICKGDRKEYKHQ